MRILFYSPDSYGLGHVRRTTAIAERVLREFPGSSALVLTGAPRAHVVSYPDHCDWVKLPSITKAEDGRYISRDLDFTIRETVGLRSRLIEEAAISFRPDVLLVDHSPAGLCGEVLPTLASLARQVPAAIRILGMRDVIDSPEAVAASWRRDDIQAVLRNGYDRVLVYGQREVFDAVTEYSLEPAVAARTEFTGYIGRNGARMDVEQARARFAPRTGRFVLVTVGGGGDGDPLVRAYLAAIAAAQESGRTLPFESVVVTGPLMSPRKRRRFEARAAGLPGVTLIESTDDMPGLMRSADLVLAMGGYNTVCELAWAGARALLSPRSFPRREQLLRAERLQQRGVLGILDEGDLEPAVLCRALESALDRPKPQRRWGLDLGGLDGTARAIGRLIEARDRNEARTARLPGTVAGRVAADEARP